MVENKAFSDPEGLVIPSNDVPLMVGQEQIVSGAISGSGLPESHKVHEFAVGLPDPDMVKVAMEVYARVTRNELPPHLRERFRGNPNRPSIKYY